MWTDEQLEHPIEKVEHNHLPNRDQVELRELHSTIKKRVPKETTLIPMIYRVHITRFSRENQATILPPMFINLNKFI